MPDAVSTSFPLLFVQTPACPKQLDVELTAKVAVSAVCEPVSPKIVTVDPDPKVMLASKVAVKVLIAPETGLLCSMVEVRNLGTIVSHVVAPVAFTYLPSSHMVQTEAPAAENLPAGHDVHALETPPGEVNTPARIEICPFQLQTTILIYRATTGSMDFSSLFTGLLEVEVGKNLTPFACDFRAENPEIGSRECCTSTSVTY
jgi:hypothetical protein